MHDAWTVLAAGSCSGEGLLQAWTFGSKQEAQAKYDSLSNYDPRMLLKGVPLEHKNCDVTPHVTITPEDFDPRRVLVARTDVIRSLEECEARLWPHALGVTQEVFDALCEKHPDYVDKNVDTSLPYLGVLFGIPLYLPEDVKDPSTIKTLSPKVLEVLNAASQVRMGGTLYSWDECLGCRATRDTDTGAERAKPLKHKTDCPLLGCILE